MLQLLAFDTELSKRSELFAHKYRRILPLEKPQLPLGNFSVLGAGGRQEVAALKRRSIVRQTKVTLAGVTCCVNATDLQPWPAQVKAFAACTTSGAGDLTLAASLRASALVTERRESPDAEFMV